MLNRRQVDVQQQNLASMCRIAVKCLLDYACLNSHVDEDCEEFINFCAVFEQMVSHRLRPYQKRVWHRGDGTPRYFWDVLLENHNRTPTYLFNSCIPNIDRIESIKSPKAKLRAFLRVALMEKRLSEYLYWLLDSKALLRQSYLDGALFTSEEATVLCGDLIGLNAIDFNFCLKGNENELLGPLEINYAPFLRHKQTSESRCIDEEEMLQLSGQPLDNAKNDNTLTDNDKVLRLQNLEKDFRSTKEQKEYLEELLRLRERQLAESKIRIEAARVNQDRIEREWNQERKTLDACILELQGAVSSLRSENCQLKSQVASLQLFKDRLDQRDVPMMDMAEGSLTDQSAGNPRGQLSSSTLGNETKSIISDERSIQSLTSDQVRLKEDSHSMIPLTGSLADVNIAMLKDQPNGNELSKEAKPELNVKDDRSANQKDEQEKDVEKGIAMSEITESFVMAEVVSNTEMASLTASQKPPESTSCQEDSVQEHESQAECTGQHDISKDSPKSSKADGVDDMETDKPLDIMTSSNGSGSSSGPELKEGEALISDPEILNYTNTSSDGSDAAWEMLSDAEQAEHSQ